MHLLGTKRARTTSYHPQANGMVKCFHRQLKAALKAQPQPDAWMDTLPLILLGIHTTLKEDISSTAAEMVYGTTLRLPGEFFTHSQSFLPDPSDFISNLKSRMHHIRPHPPRPTQRKSNISDDLSTATHVFIMMHDAVCRPLQPPYNGPYPVVKKTDKYFIININGRTDTVSIDHLKPAHLDLDDMYPTTQTAPPTSQSTRSGRRVHFPQYLSRVI